MKLRLLALGLSALLAACTSVKRDAAPSTPVVRYEPASWSQMPGWRADDTLAAWPALLNSCKAIGSKPDWQGVCALVAQTEPRSADDVRAFFQQQFQPYRIVRETDGQRETQGLVTGYYEPQLNGAREPSAQFTTPLYRRPEELLVVDLASLYPELKGKRVRGRLEGNKVVPYYSRGESSEAPGLRGHEIVWVEGALDAFLLEVQGSGRVQLATGETIRLQYEDQNGHPYRSIGKYLVDQGVFTLEQVNIPAIRDWLAANPDRLREVLDSNPSVVFFREEPLDDPTVGPKGSLGVPLTAGRSIAVDAQFVPLGAPVFLDTTQPVSALPLQRLVLAQDTGGAIRGPVRADLFCGFGKEAGDQAGLMKQDGQLWLLWPSAAPLPPPQ
jgi:membrane-bound lytic murein transglycosylase A